MLAGLNLKAFEHDDFRAFTFPGTNGGAVACVHGFPGTPDDFRTMGLALQAAGWTAHGVLLPGFGAEIATLSDRSHLDWVAHVQDTLRALRREFSPVVLVGHSMGGAVALQAAGEWAERGEPLADGLALIAPFWKFEHVLWAAMPVLKHVFREIRPFRLIKFDMNNQELVKGIQRVVPDADLTDPQVQAAIRDMALPLGLFDQLRQVGRNAYRVAPQVSLPALVIQGKADAVVRPHLTRHMVDRLRGPVRYLEVAADHNISKPTALYAPETWQLIVDTVLDFASSLKKPLT